MVSGFAPGLLGPLTSTDLMEAGGEGLKVAYQVLDETRVVFRFHVSLRVCVCAFRCKSEGSLVLVINQGFPGAYSEAAAKKAYPSCQAVPCEHFDTAFQVSKWKILLVSGCLSMLKVVQIEHVFGLLGSCRGFR